MEEKSTTNRVEDSVEILNAPCGESAIVDPIVYNNNRKNCTKHAINYLAENQMLANDVKRAHKGFFNSIIQTIQQKFEHLLQLEQDSVDFRNESHCTKTPQIIMDTANIEELFHDKWTKTLNQAVKDGEPADF